ncbi:hydroxyproline O-galactosyltransferase GALT2-like isoform X2 [Magnolia sinica]|uniref:hydroxyproline O-galactosyltransferase GALT2-like isoform X2 n=1 Tax=Magnolia sinica TaxID=86752 RepID=UPI00265A82A2|nr:hydroxyproline O-galactosyltransferase GALT2-like isoform X2 [Magnolia sinica]
MKRLKSDTPGGRRLKLSHFLIGVAALYLVFIGLKFPRFLETSMILSGDDSFVGLDRSVAEDGDGPDGNRHFFSSVYKDTFHSRLEDALTQNPPQMPWKEPFRVETSGSQLVMHRQSHYGRITGEILRRMNRTNGLTELEKMADEAWALGLKAWKELERSGYHESNEKAFVESCPSSVSLTGEEFTKADYIMLLPCGLAAGSSVTVVGTPHLAHEEYVPQLARIRNGDGRVLISQFKVELQGLKAVDGEDPPRIMHLNPRLKGDWSQRQVIEHNTCYRMQWGMAQRCNGIPSENDADMVDGFSKCEKWINDDVEDSQESKSTSWLRRFIGRAKKPEVTWPFPFVEGRLFVLTIRAGVEGYHVNAGGRHVTSFPYRTGFTLEDATGLVVNGDVDVHSIYATSLPISHPSFSLQQLLEMSEQWKSHPLQGSPAYLFIGILSATNHFAERMAIRKTWMQFDAIKSLQVVARFFVALNPRKEINAVLKKEADYFGDIVILPFMDRYELVVLKTVAICEYGIRNMSAAYIMKCDDDTFVRVDTILTVIKGTSPKKSLYMGNLNLLHTPLRSGKWAVTYELFKMEDVSMGMWVEQFNSSTTVQYSHNWKFCQYGCMEDYFTAHYQSPRQMICLWGKLGEGQAHCCNFR